MMKILLPESEGFMLRGTLETSFIHPSLSTTSNRNFLPRHCAAPFSLSSKIDDEDNENKNDDIDFGRQLQNQEDLSSSLGELFRKSAAVTTRNDEYEKAKKNGEQLEEIQIDLLMQELEGIDVPEDSEFESVFLDPNEYAAYSESQPFMSTISSSTSSVTADSFDTSIQAKPESDTVVNSIYEQIKERNTNTTNMDPETLYRKVFENEEGYFDQSNNFKVHLFDSRSESDAETDTIDDYLSKQRIDDYESRQREAMALIDQEIKEFESKLNSKKEEIKDGQAQKSVCKVCGVRLSEFDLENYDQTCHVCHGEKFHFASGVSVTKGDNYFKQDQRRSSNFRSEGNRRMERRSQSNQFQNPTSSQGNNFKNEPERFVTRSRLQGNSQIRTEKLSENTNMRIPPIQSNQELKNIQKLQGEVQKYKSLYEDTKSEMEKIREAFVELQSQVKILSDKGEGDADVSSGSSTPKEIIEDKWIELVDPDTGNVFIWNKDTDETKWKSEL